MKTQFKNPIKNFAPVFLILAAMFVLGLGCNIFKPMPDPLASWQKAYKEEPNQIIEKDCQDYIQKLSSEERKFIAGIEFFKDGTGQYAEKITIGLNGKNWRHILIYDKDNKRIKTIKYVSGDSHS